MHQVTCKRHDQLGGERNTCRLDRHQQGNATVARCRHNGLDEHKQNCEDSLGHAKSFSARARLVWGRVLDRSGPPAGGGTFQNAPSWVNVYPGSEAPLAFLVTFTRTVGTSGAVSPAGRSTA